MSARLDLTSIFGELNLPMPYIRVECVLPGGVEALLRMWPYTAHDISSIVARAPQKCLRACRPFSCAFLLGRVL